MRNASNKVLSLIGLASKAGRIASGEFSTEKSVKTGKAFLVFVAGDASENTKKKFRNMCDFYEVPVYFLATRKRWEGSAESSSAPVLPYRMKTLRKQ